MTYQQGLEAAAQNAFCDITRSGVAGGLLFAGVTAQTIAGALGGLAVAGISAHLYATYCNVLPPPPPYGSPPPFGGGQCEGVRYNVPIFYQYTDNQNGSTGRQGTIFQVYGKIHRAQLLVRLDQDNQTYFDIDGEFDTDVFQLANAGAFFFVDGERVPRYSYVVEPIVCTPVDGSPDTCGDPAGLPPAPFDAPGNVTYINRDGDTINSPVTFNFGVPRFGLNGDFFIPVDVRFDLDPTLNIGGTININNGDFIVNPGSPATPIGNGEDPGNVFIPPGITPPTPPGVPPDPPPPDPTDPVKKPEKIIRGVIVTTTAIDNRSTVIFEDTIPDIYVPNLGYVSFLCKVNGVGAWTVEIPVKNRKQIIECPWKFGAIDVKAEPIQGAQFTLTYVYDIKSL